MREVCVPCEVEMRVETVGVAILEMASFGPYRLWMADLMKCPHCGHEAVTRFANGPFTEHFQPGFEKLLAQTRTERRVIEVGE